MKDAKDGKTKIVAVVELDTDKKRNAMLDMAIAQYLGEPCRICGEILQEKDAKGMVFAGYSKWVDGKGARAAHKQCWEDRPTQSEWTYPEDDDS